MLSREEYAKTVGNAGPTQNPAESQFDNKGIQPVRVPGFGCPVRTEPKQRSERFRHGVNDFRGDRLTVREVAMLNFMNSITDKKDWQKKIFDEEIVAKWRDEANNIPLMDNATTFEWCIDELRNKAQSFEKTQFIRTLDHASVCVLSDTLVNGDLQAELKKGVQSLLEKKEKDWHPGSDDKVLNLVHPSLYPLVYGTTKALKTGQVGLKTFLDSYGKGEIVPIDKDVKDSRWSQRFQWLPCEVRFTEETGTKVEISSYINNLHPLQHEDLYHTIEKFISVSIPLWNEVLIRGDQGRTPQRILTNEADFEPQFPNWANDWRKTAAQDPVLKEKLLQYFALPDRPNYNPNDDEEPELPDDWEQRTIYDAAEWKWKRIRQVGHPEPGQGHRSYFNFEEWKQGENGTEYKPYTVKIEDEFRKQGLQVIVKLSSIELTPEKPTYDGGKWHLEGMMNEHIVATAIYYYDVQNITPAKIRFRHEAHLDDYNLSYEQDVHEPLCQVFGTDSMREEPAVQEIGSITTPDSRLLVFPNTLQHRVAPFELADKSKPGHRRFLLLWLVDPHYTVLSTANVPPQRRDWWSEETLKAVNWNLPYWVSQRIVESAGGWLIGDEEAKELRLKLMAERTVFADTVEQNFESYNLCEH